MAEKQLEISDYINDNKLDKAKYAEDLNKPRDLLEMSNLTGLKEM